jgi:hypothetical protein
VAAGRQEIGKDNDPPSPLRHATREGVGNRRRRLFHMGGLDYFPGRMSAVSRNDGQQLVVALGAARAVVDNDNRRSFDAALHHRIVGKLRPGG